MSTENGTSSRGASVTRDSKTGSSSHHSDSAGKQVDNGKHDTIASAVAAADRDFGNGPRSSGDDSYRGNSSHKR